MADGRDNPGVIAPPPLIYLTALLLGFALEYFWPGAALDRGIGQLLGILLGCAGLAFALPALLGFRRAGTSPEPWHPSTALVTSGLYRYTRNPMYVGLTLIYLGVTAAFGGVWMAAMLVPALLVMRYGVIAREERYLESKFGNAYLDYLGSVRRWF